MISKVGKSYGHTCRKLYSGHYRLSWSVDYHYNYRPVRYPRTTTRDTDEAGAKRFCKRWNVPFPE